MMSNGTHVLTVRASGAGRSATQRLVVHVANRDFALTTSALRAWQKVKGTVRIRANVRGAKTNGLGLYVDGRIDGRHWVTLAAVATDGRVAKRRLPLVVANHAVQRPKPKPRPKSLPPPKVTAQNLADGQTVSGLVDWRAHTIGPVARVEFVVDGTVIATATTEPWSTTWDSSTVAPGTHTLEVRAFTKDGRKAVLTVSVTSTPE
jgi:hypothetical protein